VLEDEVDVAVVLGAQDVEEAVVLLGFEALGRASPCVLAFCRDLGV